MTHCLRCGVEAVPVAPAPAAAAPAAPAPAPAAPRPADADVWRQSTEASSVQLGAPPPWAGNRSATAWLWDEPRRNRRYATWWERVKAAFVDCFFLLAVAVVVTLAAFPPALIYVVHLANAVVFQGLTGQTVGKRVVCIFVVRDKDEEPPGLLRIFLREIAHYLDALVLGLGYLLPLADKKKRTIADIICGTVVVS